MRVIGLTGNIGTGKSTVAKILAELGAIVLDADKLGHQVLQSHSQAWQEVTATFGKDILNPNNEIDRQKLAEIVFADSEALTRLNQIMHPKMHNLAKEQIEQWRKQGANVIVLEAPLLIEAGWTTLVDDIWVTVVPQAVVIERLTKQKGLTEAQILERLRFQFPSAEKEKQAKVIIDTNCSLDALKAKVKKLWQEVVPKERKAWT